jgi:nucleotidyltransferase/DNA polymerase involved in DNA repair
LLSVLLENIYNTMITLPPPSDDVRALADADSFFASCEVARNPALRGKPLCIARPGDIVLASTYEAKAHGVTTGTPTREAKRVLGNSAIFLPPDMAYYGRVSAQVFTCMAEYGDLLEQFSIDEAFLRLPPLSVCEGITPEVTAFNRQKAYEDYLVMVQAKIRQYTGIPFTFGAAPTRLLAKTFAKLKKPYGIYVWLDQHRITETLCHLPLIKTPFIGERTAAKIAYCRTMLDFSALSGATVRKVLGWNGLKLWLELNGVHALTIERTWPPTVISRCHSFHPHFTDNYTHIWAYLFKNFETAYKQLFDSDVGVKYLKIRIKSKSFVTYKAVIRLPRPTRDRGVLLEQCRLLLEQCWREGVLWRQTGVVFSELDHTVLHQPPIFSVASIDTIPSPAMPWPTSSRLHRVIEALNHKRWKELVMRATSHILSS